MMVNGELRWEKKSTELAQGYGWENIAQSYLELYKKVVKIEK